MKAFKRILTVFAVLNWAAHILHMTQMFLWDYLFTHDRLTGFWEIVMDILDCPAAYNVFIAPFVFLIGTVISLILMIISLRKREKTMKSDCILFAAYALSIVPLIITLGHAFLYF
ncbi:MAG: hypothetical protein J1F63_10600 [Oscillospiraceae bacterium]|nr:hypothetical protein [Oscillospiraceae bacterium]